MRELCSPQSSVWDPQIQGRGRLVAWHISGLERYCVRVPCWVEVGVSNTRTRLQVGISHVGSWALILRSQRLWQAGHLQGQRRPCRRPLSSGGLTEAAALWPLLPAPQLRLRALCWHCPCVVGGRQKRLAVRPGVSFLLADVAPGGKPSVQRPWSGHKGRDLSIFDQRLEGRWPGLWVLRPTRVFWDLKPERCVELPAPLPALAETPQHRLLGPGVWALSERMPCGAASLPRGCTGALPALRRRDLDGHRAPARSCVPSPPKPPLHVTLPGAGKMRPQDGLRRQLGRKMLLSLADHPPGLGWLPDRYLGQGSSVDAVAPMEAIPGQGRTRPPVRVPLG